MTIIDEISAKLEGGQTRFLSSTVDRLLGHALELRALVRSLEAGLAKADGENKHLADALQFYADADNYQRDYTLTSPVGCDHGQRARGALGIEEKPE